MTDISISGQGFYTIAAESNRGNRWLARNVQGFDSLRRVTYSDDTNYTKDIADGAASDGMRVEVNGVRYLAVA